MYSRSRSICVCLLLLSLAAPLQAQKPTAALVGTVRDSSGAVVPGAAIVIRNTATNERQETLSDSGGEFTIPNLAPGIYEATISKEGFHQLRETNLELQLDQVARIDFQLSVGAVAESVEVKAAVPLLNTESGTKGDVMVSTEIMSMPLNGRAVADLMFLVPGVSPSAQGANGGFSINGARGYENNYLLDGFNNTDFRLGGQYGSPNIDALEEFKVQTSNFSAEYGRLAGGVMNMALKTGGNQVHGAAFEFLRNDVLDARNFFNAGKSKLRQNQFGGTLNGPVFVPKVYNGRDHTFFLFSWESLRQNAGQTQLSVVPTLLQRQGNFSATPLKDPLLAPACTAQSAAGCFPDNIIPASRFSPVALKLLEYYPLPNQSGVNNYRTDSNGVNNWNTMVAKIDERFTAKDSLSYRAMLRWNDTISPFAGSTISSFGSTAANNTSLMGLSYTHLFTPTFINEARFGYTRLVSLTVGAHQGHYYAGDLGIAGTTTDPQVVGFPKLTVSGFAILGDAGNLPVQVAATNFQWRDTLTWVKGKHLFKFGGEVLRMQYLNAAVPAQNQNGLFNFLGRWTNQPLADFLLGLPDSASRNVGSARTYLRSTSFSGFASDDWKISPRLTLNLGLRWEFIEPANEKYGHLANFIPSIGKLVLADLKSVQAAGVIISTPNQIAVASDVGVPQSLSYPRYRNFNPRIGLAWRPFGGNRTVVRGAYGMFDGSFTLTDEYQSMSAVFPYTVSQTVTRPTNPALLTLSNPFGSVGALTGTIAANGYELHAKTPSLQSWNLTIEREVAPGAAIEAGYVGSKGTHLPGDYDANEPFRAAGLSTFPRPFPAWGTANIIIFQGNSSYNAGTVTFRRRYNRGFFFSLSHTYMKSIDSASQIRGNAAGGFPSAQDSRNLALERGRSDFDIRQSFQMFFSYQLPWHNPVAHGWQIAGTGRFQTGAPFTPRVANANVNLGEASRPNRIADGTLPNPSVQRWFDLAAFPLVPTGSFLFGNSGRNILDGPARQELNLSLQRNFNVKEKYRVQFRWEAFNVFNHTNLLLPVTTVDVPNAGTITGAAAARVMQLGLHLQF